MVDVPYLSSTLRSQEIETPEQLVLALFGGKFNGYGDNYDGDVDVGKNFQDPCHSASDISSPIDIFPLDSKAETFQLDNMVTLVLTMFFK